jgi:hypothetical protein
VPATESARSNRSGPSTGFHFAMRVGSSALASRRGGVTRSSYARSGSTSRSVTTPRASVSPPTFPDQKSCGKSSVTDAPGTGAPSGSTTFTASVIALRTVIRTLCVPPWMRGTSGGA